MAEPETTATTATTTRHAVLVRFGEIFLKGANRPYFEAKLAENLKRAVQRRGGRVERLHGRFLVWPARGDEQAGVSPALTAVSHVFGVSSVSPVIVVDKDYDAIEAAAVAAMGEALRDGPVRSFKVESRRSDKRFPVPSPEISRRVGAAIVAAYKLPVDVHTPGITVGVEVGWEHAFAFARALPGPGGLPVGCTGEVDLLLSGGIDSPVAGWMAMKRGCHLAATYFHSFPYTGDKTRDKVQRLARKLAAWQGPTDHRVVPFTDAQKALREAGPPELAVVLYRRMMVRVAAELAARRGAIALVTGDALGQVASQTLVNLAVIEEASPLPILRPLITHDKLETIGWAQRIDTYDLSIEPYEDCCSLWVPDHPTTCASRTLVAEAEARLDIAALVADCIARTDTLHCPP